MAADTRCGVHRPETAARRPAETRRRHRERHVALTSQAPAPPNRPPGRRPPQEVAVVNTGDTAWILTSAALVLLMTPGLALFYGGMVRAKSVLNMMMMSFGALALISVLWVLYGYSVAFGDDVGAGPARRPERVLRPQGPDGGHHQRGRRPARHGVRRLPGRLRHHHRRADLRRDRRPGQVRLLDGLRRRLGDDRLLPGRPLGLRLHADRRRRRGHPHRWLDRQQPGGASTSPVAPRCTSTPVRRASRSPWSSASVAASAARPCARTTCRWS